MSNPIRIVVADAQPIIREGLRLSFEREGQIEVVAEAEDGYAAMLAVSAQRPDVVILDSDLRKLDCHDAVTRIRAQSPQTRILVTYMARELFEIHAFVEAGVAGLIAKTATPREYAQAVQTLHCGGSFFPGALVGQLFAPRRAGRLATNVFGLSARETEILRFICSGFSNKDIARRLALSVRTVETHRLNIRKKTSAGRLRDLVHIARQLGLSDVDRKAGDMTELRTAV
jgi:DNA-binding NarL/FixJ family response regulator